MPSPRERNCEYILIEKRGENIMQKIQYKTRQLIELTEFMKSTEGKHVTVTEICDYFESKGIPVGMTTVYRNLEKLIQEGVVMKYVVDKNNSACFQYIDSEKNSHYHCKCEKCGKIIHLQCREVENLKSHILESHGFEMDPGHTLFLGICSNCRNVS